jgi:hypothetical protein
MILMITDQRLVSYHMFFINEEQRIVRNRLRIYMTMDSFNSYFTKIQFSKHLLSLSQEIQF